MMILKKLSNNIFKKLLVDTIKVLLILFNIFKNIKTIPNVNRIMSLCFNSKLNLNIVIILKLSMEELLEHLLIL